MQPQPATNQPYPPPTPSPPQSDTPSPPQSDTPSPQSVEQSPQVTGAGTSSSTHKRGPTIGKSLDKLLAHKEGEKLVVTVPEEMNAFCGINATMAATDLGVQIRKRCPTQGFASSWKFVDPLIKASILQSNQVTILNSRF
ncbi:hypothetical protein Vadar_026588 [Vaccinium darrowii]|uniref:Uncharacterized protein n=1 Tax=Vaccinium darrowii TaxID=229202 RepID=A0ACB7XTA9_9ERIC|nr:hypothetical protein Vadar_026588 [Vaccinium darrowii]